MVRTGARRRREEERRRTHLVEYGDPRLLLLFDKVLDHGGGLVVVAPPHVDDVLFPGPPQEHGAGEGSEEGNVRGLGNGNSHFARGRPDLANQGVHLVLLDELARVLSSGLRLVLVVVADELELEAVHPARVVRLLEGRENAVPHADPEGRGGAREGAALAEDELQDTGASGLLGRRGRRRRLILLLLQASSQLRGRERRRGGR